MIQRLWADESGFVVSTELMLVATMLALGMLVGMVTVRDQVIQEIADVGAAIAGFNQSFSISAITGHNSSAAGTDFLDRLDNCQGVFTDNPPGQAALCIGIAVIPNEEG